MPAWTSDLTVGRLAALEELGFQAVGQVRACAVDNLGWSGWASCGIWNVRGGPPRTNLGAFGPRVAALHSARRRVLDRLVEHCTLMGGDGVVGLRFTVERFAVAAEAVEAWEIKATGTAVRNLGTRHTRTPFLATCDGAEVSQLLRRGWVPVGLAIGIASGLRHRDQATWQVQRSWSNSELSSYTACVHDVRVEARSRLAADVARQGADDVVLQRMELDVREGGCTLVNGAVDHHAEATVLGTSLARFRSFATEDEPGTLRILRLDQKHENVLSNRLLDQEQP